MRAPGRLGRWVAGVGVLLPVMVAAASWWAVSSPAAVAPAAMYSLVVATPSDTPSPTPSDTPSPTPSDTPTPAPAATGPVVVQVDPSQWAQLTGGQDHWGRTVTFGLGLGLALLGLTAAARGWGR